MRAKNMQALTNDVRATYPGVVVYGIGDEDHKERASDHNEDDTTGVRAAQTDPDSNPEHRAIDIMLGPAFTREQARQLVANLMADPGAKARLFYINFENWQWSRSNGWQRRDNSDDPHPDHVHISGWAADDENDMGWPAVRSNGGSNVFCKKGDKNENVRRLQLALNRLEPNVVTVDADYGDQTAAAVKRLLGGTGAEFNPELSLRLDEKLAVRAVQMAGLTGLKGDKGDPGPAGPPGKTPTEVTVTMPSQTIKASVTAAS